MNFLRSSSWFEQYKNKLEERKNVRTKQAKEKSLDTDQSRQCK